MLSLGLALFSPLAGRLVEHHGPRPINVIGILLSGIGLGALHLALLWDERMLFGVRLSLGAADALTFVAAEYALLRGTPESRRARVMAAYTAGFGLGFMGGSSWAILYTTPSAFPCFGSSLLPPPPSRRSHIGACGT